MYIARWIGAIGPWVVAIVAIWGEKIKSWLFTPNLRISLLDARGELIRGGVLIEGQPQTHLTRWYHIRLTNESRARFPAAHDARVMLVRVEKPGPADGPPQVIYQGALPLRWQHQETDPALRRTIGPEAVADLLFVSEHCIVNLTPLLIPNNLPANLTGEMKLWVTLQARSTEADSNVLRVEIAWDGQWDTGEEEMARHLVLRV